MSEFNECRANVRREASSSGNTPIKQDTQGSSGGGGVGAAVDDVLECMYFRAPKRNIRKGFVRVGYGIYVKPLEYWWGVFPRSQLLVLSSDEVKDAHTALSVSVPRPTIFLLLRVRLRVSIIRRLQPLAMHSFKFTFPSLRHFLCREKTEPVHVRSFLLWLFS